MNWQQYWNDLANRHNPHDQVARTGGRTPINEALLDRIAKHILDQLDIQATDRVLDICCGNGQLSQRLARHCRELVGVDLSENQIQLAQDHAPGPNIQYFQANATELDRLRLAPFDKINLYFSFQYLDRFGQGVTAISQMKSLLNPSGKIFLGDVPDLQKLAVFYPGPFARLKYYAQLSIGRSPMGKFWGERELRNICQMLNLQLDAMDQESWMPYAHYRRDYLLSEVLH